MTINRNVAKVELLGVPSAKNRKLKAHLLKAVEQLALDISIEEISDIDSLLKYDISGIPALLVNGKVVSQEQVPSTEELMILLTAALTTEDLPD